MHNNDRYRLTFNTFSDHFVLKAHTYFKIFVKPSLLFKPSKQNSFNCIQPTHTFYLGNVPFQLNQLKHFNCLWKHLNVCIHTSGGPLSALTRCVNVRPLSGENKNIAVNLFSKLGWELGLYYASYDDFHLDILARMYTELHAAAYQACSNGCLIKLYFSIKCR